MPVVPFLLGRFGNCLFEYCTARKAAEIAGDELHTDDWVGKRIFQINHPHANQYDPAREWISETEAGSGKKNVLIRGHCQRQEALIYTRSEARRWLKLQPQWQAIYDSTPICDLVAHQRVGDYHGHGFPVIGREAYLKACDEFGYDRNQLRFVTEEQPLLHPQCQGEFSFLPDFFLLMKAKVMFRGNSTFSMWAHWLAEPYQRVYAPLCTNLIYGEHNDVPFVEGNWPKCLDGRGGITDLHMAD